MIIDIYPKEVVTATLRCEIGYLKQKLKRFTTDKRLYAMPSQQAFAEIYGITFPEDIDSDNEDCFDITPASLSDHNCFVFAVCDGVNVRVLTSELVYEMEYQWSEQALTREVGQKIVDAGTTVERRGLEIPADRSYITVEPDQTAESYTTGLRQKYITALVLTGVYVLLYVAAWCVIGGMKRRTGQV